MVAAEPTKEVEKRMEMNRSSVLLLFGLDIWASCFCQVRLRFKRSERGAINWTSSTRQAFKLMCCGKSLLLFLHLLLPARLIVLREPRLLSIVADCKATTSVQVRKQVACKSTLRQLICICIRIRIRIRSGRGNIYVG